MRLSSPFLQCLLLKNLLMTFHNTGIHCFLVGVCALTRYSFLWLPCALSCVHLTGHSRTHGNFLFLSCAFDGLFILSSSGSKNR